MKKRIAETMSIMDVLELFPNEEESIKWFEELLWGDKKICPHCGCFENVTQPQSKKKKFIYWCKDCQSHFSVRVGTVMESSKIPIQKWAVTAYYLMTARKGISSLQLSKEISVTQKTAWFMLHRLREACQPKDWKLVKEAEVDEMYLGGLERNKHMKKRQNKGRGPTGKIPVIGMKEREGGRVKAFVLQNAQGHTLRKAVRENIEPGAMLYTDENRGYVHLGDKYGGEYKHQRVRHSAKQYVDGMAHTNSIESVWAVIKRGFKGIYHHWDMKHCQRYIDEFTFRLNEGNCEIDTIDRIKSLFNAMYGKRIKYKELIS